MVFGSTGTGLGLSIQTKFKKVNSNPKSSLNHNNQKSTNNHGNNTGNFLNNTNKFSNRRNSTADNNNNNTNNSPDRDSSPEPVGGTLQQRLKNLTSKFDQQDNNSPSSSQPCKPSWGKSFGSTNAKKQLFENKSNNKNNDSNYEPFIKYPIPKSNQPKSPVVNSGPNYLSHLKSNSNNKFSNSKFGSARANTNKPAHHQSQPALSNNNQNQAEEPTSNYLTNFRSKLKKVNRAPVADNLDKERSEDEKDEANFLNKTPSPKLQHQNSQSVSNLKSNFTNNNTPSHSVSNLKSAFTSNQNQPSSNFKSNFSSGHQSKSISNLKSKFSSNNSNQPTNNFKSNFGNQNQAQSVSNLKSNFTSNAQNQNQSSSFKSTFGSHSQNQSQSVNSLKSNFHSPNTVQKQISKPPSEAEKDDDNMSNFGGNGPGFGSRFGASGGKKMSSGLLDRINKYQSNAGSLQDRINKYQNNASGANASNKNEDSDEEVSISVTATTSEATSSVSQAQPQQTQQPQQQQQFQQNFNKPAFGSVAGQGMNNFQQPQQPQQQQFQQNFNQPGYGNFGAAPTNNFQQQPPTQQPMINKPTPVRATGVGIPSKLGSRSVQKTETAEDPVGNAPPRNVLK